MAFKQALLQVGPTQLGGINTDSSIKKPNGAEG